MTINQLAKYYGSFYAAARALGVTRQLVAKWKKKNNIPLLQQYRYAILTNGELTVRDDFLRIQLHKKKEKNNDNKK